MRIYLLIVCETVFQLMFSWLVLINTDENLYNSKCYIEIAGFYLGTISVQIFAMKMSHKK